MPHLVAIDLPGGQRFVDAVRHEWEAGNAVLPVDRRLPPPARAALLAAMAPDVLLDETGRHRFAGRGVEPGDALVIVTSGSTGAPKGVVLTHAALHASATASSERLGVRPDDTWLACLPLSHVGGFSVVTRALLTDTRLVVHDAFDIDSVRRAAHEGATAVSLVTTALRRIDPAWFRVILLGGSRPPDQRPPNAVTTYGLTETGSGIVYDGRPLDGVEVRLAGDGEVLVRGPMLLRAYRDGTTPLDAEGWLHTGDLGRRTDGGRLDVLGRRGDLIITGGENVWPEPVEAALRSHPAVADAAVAGVDDPEWGQRVVAWVVPRGVPPQLAELRAHVAATMPGYCAPKELHIVSTLPRTTLGKIRRSMLPRGPEQ